MNDYDREYNPPSFSGECANCKRLENENRRMKIAFASLQRIAGDMLNPERRAGPQCKPD